MPDLISCDDCKNEIPQPASCCPHCGRWAKYWNVINANKADERTALKTRYDAAKADALARGADAAVQEFETAVADSKAVIARSIEEVQRLARSTHEIFGPYYRLIEAELKLPDGDDWDMARQLTDTVLFPHHKEQIRFAALSLDGIGLSKYGGCSIQIRNDMIAHRASVIEENSVLFMEHRNVKVSRTPGVPKGYRAPWAERDKICTAKLAARVDSATTRNQYSNLLLKQGATSADDEFVEVHIWGPMSVLSIEKVTITDSKGASETILKSLISQLEEHGVTVA